MKSTELQAIYFRFLNLFRAIEDLPGFPALDGIEKSLLDELSLNWQRGHNLLVSQAINLPEIGSPATLHARLKNLHKMGMIEYAVDKDARKKYIQPTEKALKYFGQISDCMNQAISAN